MPAPVEYNNVRRMSTISAPIHDINFDTYDFLLCRPQTDVKDTFESRELEASYCRDFACCGLILNDLHDLLQHYEECHVRLEEDNVLFEDEDDSSDGDMGIQAPLEQQEQQQRQPQQHDDQGLAAFGNSQDLDMSHLKKKAAAYLSDLCQQQQQQQQQQQLLVGTGDDCDLDSMKEELIRMQQQQTQTGKKRSFEQSNAMELITQSAVKKFALATNLIQPLNPCDTTTRNNATSFTDEDFLAHAGVLLASSAHHSHLHADKPYKCKVQGCGKAYKNPNGLKYHNEHGHCNLGMDDSENVASKPYQCTIGDCGKRYKNLNGLKYHIEHSHVAALNYTLATFGTSFFQQQHPHYHLPYNPSSSQASSSLSTPNLSPSSSPELSCLSPIF